MVYAALAKIREQQFVDDAEMAEILENEKLIKRIKKVRGMPGQEKGSLSSNYRIFEAEQFQKDLKEIATSRYSKIVHKLRSFVYPQLREHPHFGPIIRKLKNFKSDTWRYRIGAWRFFCEIDEQEKIVFMLAASHRSKAY